MRGAAWIIQNRPCLSRAPHLAVRTPPCPAAGTPPGRADAGPAAAPIPPGLAHATPTAASVPPAVPARSRAHLVPPTFSCTISPLPAAAAAKLPQCPPAMSAAGAGARARSGGSAAGTHSERRASCSVPARACLPRRVLDASAARGCRPPAQPGLSSGSTGLHGGRHNRLEDGSPRGTKSRNAGASRLRMHLWIGVGGAGEREELLAMGGAGMRVFCH